jgi:hypothetical protein
VAAPKPSAALIAPVAAPKPSAALIAPVAAPKPSAALIAPDDFTESEKQEIDFLSENIGTDVAQKKIKEIQREKLVQARMARMDELKAMNPNFTNEMLWDALEDQYKQKM